MRKILGLLGGIVVLSGVGTLPAFARDELKELMGRVLATPEIRAESEFAATVIVRPGQLYDPVWIMARDGAAWTNDDGGEEGDKGSRIVEISKTGALSDIVELGRMLPVTGFGIAPGGFGEFAGQLISMTQPEIAAPGATKNHVIQRLDLKSKDVATEVCTLPTAGNANKGVAGFGADARFGPAGSPFANRFFAATIFNNTIYQLQADGSCTPFVIFDGNPWSEPAAMAFSADGQRMLVSVTKGNTLGGAKAEGAILSVAADGKVDPKPVAEGFNRPMGMAYAPESFGSYAGQLFVADAGKMEIPVPMTQALAVDGKVYRVAADGALHAVATGFLNPTGVAFVDNALWVSDINGDFIAGKRELPDGFIAEIQYKK